MNPLEQIKKELAIKCYTDYPSAPFSTAEALMKGFDAVIQLNLPVKFTEWAFEKQGIC